MTLLVLGLILFLGMHSLAMVPALRDGVAARLGDKGYRGMFTLIAVAGIVLIVLGYRGIDPTLRVFDPVPAAVRSAPFVMVIAFILFAASHMRAHLRQWVGHPMVIGTLLWSGVHFLANGDLRGTVLFGSFFVWFAIDLVSAYARHATKPFEPVLRQDLMAIAGGIVVALVFMVLHGPFFGQAVVSFGL